MDMKTLDMLHSEVTIEGQPGLGKTVLRLFQCGYPVTRWAGRTGSDGRVNFWGSGQVAVQPTTREEAIRLGRAWVRRDPENRAFVSSIFQLMEPGSNEIPDWKAE
jgi:hypothetical protein